MKYEYIIILTYAAAKLEVISNYKIPLGQHHLENLVCLDVST